MQSLIELRTSRDMDAPSIFEIVASSLGQTVSLRYMRGRGTFFSILSGQSLPVLISIEYKQYQCFTLFWQIFLRFPCIRNIFLLFKSGQLDNAEATKLQFKLFYTSFHNLCVSCRKISLSGLLSLNYYCSTTF